ncbi:uncharacterized protein LOC112439800 isoform X4 [Pan paniscus]|uniref:uncharacterized protein LOC112439800 isoform X4 n=1 Tax=Pan paniscus TaxID=9597 RepID=UPI0007DBB4E6|nr:uncharacterized protein LOC745304 isoform X4 [Pan troglodytes]XP_034805170.1 uncharacterized protein LOC112439800 isoform X2 [Pan paniscus]
MFLDLCGRIVGNTESGESAKKYFSPPWKVSGPAQTPHAQGRLHSHGDGLLAGIMTVVFLAVAIAFGFYIHIGSRGFFLSLFEGSHPLDPQSAWRPLSNRSWSCFDSCAPGLPRTRLELLNQAFRFISVNNHHKYLLSILHLLEASWIILLNPHHSSPLREGAIIVPVFQGRESRDKVLLCCPS